MQEVKEEIASLKGALSPAEKARIGLDCEWDAWGADGQHLKRHEPNFQLPATLQLAATSSAHLLHLSSICRDVCRKKGCDSERWWDAAGDALASGSGKECVELLNSDDVALVGSSAGRHGIPALVRSRKMDLSSCNCSCLRKLASSKLEESLRARSGLGRVAKEALGLELAGKNPNEGAHLSYWSGPLLSNSQLERAMNDAACLLAAREKLISMGDALGRSNCAVLDKLLENTAEERLKSTKSSGASDKPLADVDDDAVVERVRNIRKKQGLLTTKEKGRIFESLSCFAAPEFAQSSPCKCLISKALNRKTRRALAGIPKNSSLNGLEACVTLHGCHFLDRYKWALNGSVKAEPLCRLLMRLMSNAAHLIPSAERQRVIDELRAAHHLSEVEAECAPETTIQAKANPVIPPPEILMRRIQNVVDLLRELKLSNGRAPALRNHGREGMQETHASCMRHAALGCVSDPEGASMHALTEKSKSGELSFRRARGASPLEGLHSAMSNWLPRRGAMSPKSSHLRLTHELRERNARYSWPLAHQITGARICILRKGYIAYADE